jgi:hypothetical protein
MLGRPSQGWVSALCCFHEDKRPSLHINLATGGYFCFSCQASGGDVIDFLRQRYSLDFRGALEYLGIASTTQYDRAAFRAFQREREQRAAKKEEERRRRIEARDWLHCLERCYEDANQRLSELRQGGAEHCDNETELCWEILASILDRIREAGAEYFALAGVGQ